MSLEQESTAPDSSVETKIANDGVLLESGLGKARGQAWEGMKNIGDGLIIEPVKGLINTIKELNPHDGTLAYAAYEVAKTPIVAGVKVAKGLGRIGMALVNVVGHFNKDKK